MTLRDFIEMSRKIKWGRRCGKEPISVAMGKQVMLLLSLIALLTLDNIFATHFAIARHVNGALDRREKDGGAARGKAPWCDLTGPLVLRMTPYLHWSICPTCIGPYVHLAAVCPHRAGAVPVAVDQQHSTLPIRTPCPLGLEEKHPTGMGAEPARFLPPSLLPVVGGLGKP